MKPLDFRSAPPRGPRTKLAAIYFTARVVDKLRAEIRGGHLNGYLAKSGFSLLWAYYTKIDLERLSEVVNSAPSESDVERWIIDQTAGIDKDKINSKMERFVSSRTPQEDVEEFERLYPLNLRTRYTVIFDLLEADDERIYGRGEHADASQDVAAPR